MKKINLLIGLPGSGKTTWLSQKANQNYVLDDISQTDPNLTKLKHVLSEDQELWISDVCFCDKEVLMTAINKLKELSKEEIEFSFVLFKQTKQECIENVHKRNDGRLVLNSIEFFSEKINDTFSFVESNFKNVYSFIICNKNKRKIT